MCIEQIKRGSVEVRPKISAFHLNSKLWYTNDIYLQGLNPLMFLFALIANATYVGRFFLLDSGFQKKHTL